MEMVAPRRESGFTLLEMTAATILLGVGLVMLTGLVVPLNVQAESDFNRQRIVDTVQSIVEEIHGGEPDMVAQLYNGATFNVADVTGNGADGSAITVAVDSTNPKLLVVTITAAWTVGTTAESAIFQTEVYNPKG